MVNKKKSEIDIKALMNEFIESNTPQNRGWSHITKEERAELHKKNEELSHKKRFECMGLKDDLSDRCDFYDTEGYCRYYGHTWKGDDGVFAGAWMLN